MSATRWLALGLLGACWRDAVPPATVPEPRPSAHFVHHAPSPRKDGVSAELAAELRANGSTDLASYIDGPIVAYDLDASKFDTLCGTAAEQATHEWGAKFADVRRPAPICASGSPPEITCMQYGGDVLVVYFDATEAPRITGAIVGSGAHPSFGGSVSPVRSQGSAASCP